MTSSSPGWARAERLDADRIAETVHARTGVRLVVEGPCPGGQVGAAYVRWPDGHRAVLKWRPHVELAALQAGPLAVTETLRAGGFPAPATELATQIGHAVVVVQELLPGAKIDRLDHHGLDQALALNASLAGRLAGRTDIPPLNLHLRSDGPGYCLHGPLREHSGRSAALERWITSAGAGHPDVMAGYDAVHQDFHPGNLLAVDGSVTGVIDWDGAARGDRRFDLVTLRFGIHPEQADADVVARLDAVLDAIPPDILRPAWAHMSLRMTDWAIRHFSPEEVDRWLDLAEQRAR
ncbi:aminoglycoside phosphotransferase [Streptomyces sp. 150FB]|uniref:phosphotransferase n=1 Tax=Streptomyces sp. 150FB TaxID=1576605 RepID=UPI000588ED18|nr:phosphotransferase [Streptomyces sp. 150FB]KIF77077.1 aminoglycoside phosphotransferase [Streptomyces sp. 150FB]